MRNVKNVMKCISAAYVDSKKKHFEPPHDKTNKMTFVPSEVFAVCSVGSLGSNCASGGQRWLWSDWADARLIWVFAGRTDHFVGFVMLWLNFHIETTSETIAYGIVMKDIYA